MDSLRGRVILWQRIFYCEHQTNRQQSSNEFFTKTLVRLREFFFSRDNHLHF
jgi:hypothetical protein